MYIPQRIVDLWQRPSHAQTPDCALGRVSACSGSRGTLWTETGPVAFVAGGAGTGLEMRPLVGDWVLFRRLQINPPFPLVEVLPRSNTLTRKKPDRTSASQELAANVDLVFLVTAANRDFNRHRLERYAALAAAAHCHTLVLLNKVDQCGDLGLFEQFLAPLDLPWYGVSALTGKGLDQLHQLLEPGSTFVFLGSSGVGKSSLINALLGGSQQAVGAVRTSDQKGRHTTTARGLHLTAGGAWLLDTPGLRQVGLAAVGDGLEQVFFDVVHLAEYCRFRDCNHQNEPGCAVLAAQASGLLDADRLAHYQHLQAEASYYETRQNTGAALARKAKDKRLHKEIRRRLRHKYK